jgi:SNF2 family DNA or RNA helicase
MFSGALATFTSEYDPDLVDWVKAMPGRKWDPKKKLWTFPLTPVSVERLRHAPAHVKIPDDAPLVALERVWAENAQASSATAAQIKIEGLHGELLPFQAAGVSYALANGRTLIADEMGLGKTIQAIATVQAANAYPALVVVPAVVKLNWKREWHKWVPDATVAVASGRTPPECFVFSDPGKTVLVVNYDILEGWTPTLGKMGFASIVLDESHYVKNSKAKRSKAAKKLAKDIPLRLLLTGTPVLNRPVELVSQLDIAGLIQHFGGPWSFLKRYCDAHQTQYGWDFSGASHLDELHDKLRQVGYVRRTKAQVLSELPAKRRATVPVELADRERYAEALRSLRRWCREKVESDTELMALLEDLDPSEQERRVEVLAELKQRRMEQAEALTKIEALKQVAAEEKLPEVLAWISNFLDSGEKLVVFAHHKHIVQRLISHLHAQGTYAVYIVGDTPMDARQAAVDSFQNDDNCRVLVGNIQAAGVGITLTAASNVAFVELPWRPGDLDQAEDRCHRIGQTDSVTAWYLLAADTIDEMIARMLDDKRTVVDAATDGKLSSSDGLVAALMRELAKGGD